LLYQLSYTGIVKHTVFSTAYGRSSDAARFTTISAAILQTSSPLDAAILVATSVRPVPPLSRIKHVVVRRDALDLVAEQGRPGNATR
jgi:hypothetical protein